MREILLPVQVGSLLFPSLSAAEKYNEGITVEWRQRKDFSSFHRDAKKTDERKFLCDRLDSGVIYLY